MPELQYLMIDGRGDPNSPAFGEAVAALYPVAYRLKFASKQMLDRDYVVMPLEGLWWAADRGAFTTARDKSRWNWTVMTMVPDWITRDMFTTATDQAGAKRPARLDDVRFETLREGTCVQALHVGAFDDEGPLIAKLHRFISDHALTPAGQHHEIYLSDFRTVEAAQRRTIVRQPAGRSTA